jgi:small-conductance mechanosensitive channel
LSARFLAAHPALEEVLVSVALLLAAYLAARFVSYLLGAAIQRSSRGGTDQRLLSALKRPVTYALFLVGARAAVNRLPVSPRVDALLDSVLFAFGVMLIALLLARAYAILLDWYAARPQPDPASAELAREFNPLFSKVGTVFIALVAMSMLLQHFGVNVASLVVSLGVGSLAVGLAAQDTLSNMFAGFTILLDRPFRVGDRIQLATGEVGDVQSIGMRATVIKTADETILIVPNSILVKERLVNQSRPTRHLVTRVEVAVAFGSDLRRVKDVLLRAARSSARVDQDQEAVVQITRFAESAVNFVMMFWARDYAEQGLARTEVYEAVQDGLVAAGIPMPRPTRRIITEHEADGGPPPPAES